MVEADIVAAADLPEAGEAGLHAQALEVFGCVSLDLPGEGGPRSHEAHLAAQHVDHLRHLVQRGLPQDATHGRDPRVGLRLEGGSAGLVEVVRHVAVSVRAHAAQLVHAELPAALADPVLPVDGRRARGDDDREAGEQQQRRRDHHEDHRAENVERSLRGEVQGVRFACGEDGLCGSRRQGCLVRRDARSTVDSLSSCRHPPPTTRCPRDSLTSLDRPRNRLFHPPPTVPHAAEGGCPHRDASFVDH